MIWCLYCELEVYHEESQEFRGRWLVHKQWGGVHKKAAGRLLDGRQWNEMPEGGVSYAV